jgi:hypothetical protein
MIKSLGERSKALFNELADVGVSSFREVKTPIDPGIATSGCDLAHVGFHSGQYLSA